MVTAVLVTMGYYLRCYFSVTIFVRTLIFPSVCGSVSHEVPSMERAGLKGCLGHRNKLNTTLRINTRRRRSRMILAGVFGMELSGPP